MIGLRLVSMSPSRRISAPRPPDAPLPFRFPLIASLAPVVAALALWLVTSSPFALLFAVLGPITALASFADSRFGARRSVKREQARFALEARTVVAAIEQYHASERVERAELSPAAEEIVSRHGADPYRWKATGSAVLVTVGVGTVRSSLQFDRTATTPGSSVDAELADIDIRAGQLTDAPVLVDARLGIGVCGPTVHAAAVARAVALQLAWAFSPATHWIATAVDDAQWSETLPHRQRRAVRSGYVFECGGLDDDRAFALVAVSRAESDLPGECRVVIRVGGGQGAEIVQHPDREQRRSLRAAVVSREAASAWAVEICGEAVREGLVSPGFDLPESLALSGLLRSPESVTDSSTLAVECAVDASGPVTLDIVTQGPHAVIGGTTGSGKSELLISWVIAMAARNSPECVNFLLIDFKGGSAFAALEVLPHTVGIITDLDARQASRALVSLRAELRYRERILAEVGARDIRAANTAGVVLSRLVIVIDEFAAMISDHPDLHPLFVDIASRGRSLGLHLVLCTQRPAGVVRDGVLANVDLRISLRVNNRADSTAVIGTDAAAELSVEALGRGIISVAGREPQIVQFALASPNDAIEVAQRWQGAGLPRRPWCEPLPLVVVQRELSAPSGNIAFGISDLPQEQRRAIATWNPRDDGHVLVLGAPRSGKSTAVWVMAGDGLLVPATVAAAWDALHDLEHARDTIAAIDDIDSLLSRFPPEHRDAFISTLSRLLRDGPARGITMILAAQRLTADVNPLTGLVPSRLLLRHSSKSEFVLAGGDGACFDSALPPGGGSWRGNRVQVASDSCPGWRVPEPRIDALSRELPWVIVSSRAASLSTQLAATGLEVQTLDDCDISAIRKDQVIIGDVEEWQSRWGLLPTLKPIAQVIFDQCTIADYRALTRSRQLPPPLTAMENAVWLEQDSGACRAYLPLPTPEFSLPC
ncbi:MAG: FtsK/SpoIIIE domain-containing protein [Rhodoglobus sp.]